MWWKDDPQNKTQVNIPSDISGFLDEYNKRQLEAKVAQILRNGI
jgi:hypothetical protein